MAGIDTIEHMTMIEEDTLEMMKTYDKWYVPTLSAGYLVVENANIEGYYPSIVAKKALELGSCMKETFKKALNKGIKIALGSDAGVYEHGNNWKEFAYYVENGMKNYEAIKCGTINAAKLLKMSDKIGSLEIGK